METIVNTRRLPLMDVVVNYCAVAFLQTGTDHSLVSEFSPNSYQLQ